MRSFVRSAPLLAVLLLVAAAAVEAAPVVVYRDANYAGPSQELDVGRHPLRALRIGNDQVSSLRVAAGYRVTLWEHEFQGRSVVATSNVAFLRDFNDVTSSIVVERIEQPRPEPRPTGPVVIFRDSNYEGPGQALDVGRHALRDLRIGNDQVSSVAVKAGYRVTLYEHEFTGGTRVLTRNTPFVGDFNDKTSSIVVDVPTPVTIYRDARFAGPSQTLGLGRHALRDLRIGNDQVSSLRVPAGYRVTLYEHEFAGRSKVVTGDVSFLSDFNDVTSSIVVELP